MRWLLVVLLSLVPATVLGQEPRPPARPAPPATQTDGHLPYIDAAERFQQRVFDVAAPSIVLIERGDSIGTGFFVTAEGLILTNRHVVHRSKKVKVTTYEGAKVDGVVVELAEGDLDLALVKVEGGPFRPLKMAPLAKLRVGSWAATIGHGYGGAWTFTTGMISNIYPVGEEKPIVQTQIPVNPGNSGGPILDKNGDAVAVVTAKLQAADNINFSIRLDMAFKSLRMLAESCECLVIRTIAGVPIFIDGLLVGNGPRVLVPMEPGAYEVVVPAAGGLQRKVTFPETRVVELLPEGASAASAVAADVPALSVWTLDFDRTSDLAIAPRVLGAWIGQPVTVERRDGAQLAGTLQGFRPPATLKLGNEGQAASFLNLWDIRRIDRR